jgi:hypothetical protein
MGYRAETEPDEAWLIKRIQAHVRDGINGDDGEVSDVRQTVFDAYMGGELGNEREGESRIVTREVLQAIEWALPALIRVFLGGVQVVAFRPSGPDDVEQARLETEAVAYWFHDGNPNQSGFIILYTFLKDLLMNPNAYLSVDPVEEEDTDTQTMTGVSEGYLNSLPEGAEYQINETRQEIDPMTGEPVDVHEAVVTTTRTVKRVEVAALPPDCVIIAKSHHQLNLDRSKAIIIRDTDKTVSDLRELGYEFDVEDLGPHENDDTWNDEETNRLFYSDEQEDGGGEDSYDTEADKPVIVHTCYMRVDWDDDGISELRRIVMAGCCIIENEPWETQPVIAGSALPVPHKHVGMGYGELVLDLQNLMTTLTRQLLNNIYAQNVQRTYINESALLSDGTTMDQLQDATNQYILMRGDPHAAVMPEVITPIVTEITQALEAVKETPQLRTGVAPQLSLDPSVLEKSTMGAFMGALDQASQRLELLARLVAETVLKPCFLKIHHTVRTHFDEPQQIEVNGKWVTVDPRTWKKRSSMTCNVGLGFNNRQVMLQLLKELLMIQKEALPTGLADPRKIFATLEKLIEHGNLGHVGSFFNDPKEPGFKAPPPPKDPAMILAEAQAEALRAEMKRKDAELKMKMDEQKEKAEAEAAKLFNDLLHVKLDDAKGLAEIAEKMAQITALNRAEKNQAEPAEDSSGDEFARAAGLVGDTAGDREAERTSKQKPGKGVDHSADIADIKQRLSAKKRAIVDRDPAGKVVSVRLEDDEPEQVEVT